MTSVLGADDAHLPVPDIPVLRFKTTARASVDARALANPGLARFDLIIDSLAVLLGIALLFGGLTLIGSICIVVAVLSLFGSRFHPVQQAILAIRGPGLFGRITEVTVEDGGVRFENPLGSSWIPWSSINQVRANSRTVAFFRDRLLLGYIPSEAFATPAALDHVVAYARSRITRS